MTRTSAEQYQAPAILASYSTDELISDAVACVADYIFSDAGLKDEIRPIDEPLAKLEQIGTRP